MPMYNNLRIRIYISIYDGIEAETLIKASALFYLQMKKVVLLKGGGANLIISGGSLAKLQQTLFYFCRAESCSHHRQRKAIRRTPPLHTDRHNS